MKEKGSLIPLHVYVVFHIGHVLASSTIRYYLTVILYSFLLFLLLTKVFESLLLPIPAKLDKSLDVHIYI
jgi:hypothetical protein